MSRNTATRRERREAAVKMPAFRLLSPLLALSLLVSASFSARAAQTVAPGSLATTQGDTGNLFPLLSPKPLRYQQVIDHSQFASFAAGGEYITQIAFRVHSPGIAFSGSADEFQVNLSTTAKMADNLSSTFAENVGADDAVVFPAAAISFSSSVSGPAEGPQAFDLVITLATPFLYDPSKGNLLVDIRNGSGSSHDPANDQQIDAVSAGDDGISRVYNYGDAAATVAGEAGSGFQMDTFGVVIRFTSSATAPVDTPAHTLLNSSTRLRVQTGDNVLIGGFIVRGGTKKVILRAIGPSLQSKRVVDALVNPTLELHDGTGSLIASNDDWVTSAQKQEIVDSTIAPADDKESAIVATLAEGNYTAVVAGAGGTSGVGLVEVYDLSRTSAGRLLNLSTRGRIETGEGVMIGGFILGGDQDTRVVVRAIGPSLAHAKQPVADALPDPLVELHDAQGALLETNDDWMQSAHKQEIIDSSLAPTNDKESAILATLPAANYTAIVRGVNGATGVGLVEIYNLD